jgi:hypothetical protein
MLATAEQRFPANVRSTTVELRPASRDDIPALSAFLRQVFRLPATAAFLDQRHIEWKYWGERQDWIGSRSLTARHGDRIIAHVAAWPIRVRLTDRVLDGAHLIDWASDPKYPGVGNWLVRQVRIRTPLLIATGGTEIARRTLPVLGFRPFGEVGCFARPLRPFRQLRTTVCRTWRSSARALRNSMWRLYPPLSPPSGWSAAPADPGEIDGSVWPAASDTMAVTARDAAFYRYLLSSPVTRHTLFALRYRGALAGFFCISHARHVARIADLWVTSSAVEDWSAAFRTAAGVAAELKDMYEVTAWSSTPLGKEALERAGFRQRDRAPLSVFGNVNPLDGRGLHVQMLDCDASFLGADEVRYLT